MAKYSSNYLEKVVIRLDFEDVSLAKIGEYQTKIGEIFDINSAQNGFEGSFNIDVVEGVVSQSKSELAIWEMKSTAYPDKKITLSQKWITIEYDNRSYVDSSDLMSDIDSYIQTFLEDFEVKLINRIGLRYINQITLPSIEDPLVWDGYINKDLMSGLSFAANQGSPLSRSFTQQFYKVENTDLTFSYGIWNDDFPNTITGKTFILDFDCASSIPRDTSDVTLRTEIKSYNQIVERYFEASIEDGLRREMGMVE